MGTSPRPPSTLVNTTSPSPLLLELKKPSLSLVTSIRAPPPPTSRWMPSAGLRTNTNTAQPRLRVPKTHQHHADTADEAKYGKRYPTCVEYGFVNFETPSTAVKQFATEVFGQSYALTTAARVHTDRRLCTLEDPSAAKDIQTTTLPALRAEVGTYKICYFVKDLEGNTQCEDSLATCRTVEVKDTLPPVLTLKYRGNILNTDSAGNNIMESTTPFHANKASLSPITNKQRNPALFKIGAHTSKHTNFGNPHISSDADAAAAIDGSYQADYSLMAQAATTNGWLIAAVASGIAGVALFSVSLKKSDNQVPVPV